MIWYSTSDLKKSWKYCKYLQKNLLLFTVFCPTLFKFGWISLDPSHSCLWLNKQGNERNFVKSASVRSKLLARPVLSYCICKLTLHYILLFTTVLYGICNGDPGVPIPRGPHSRGPLPWGPHSPGSSWEFNSSFPNDSPKFLNFIRCSPRSPRKKNQLQIVF